MKYEIPENVTVTKSTRRNLAIFFKQVEENNGICGRFQRGGFFAVLPSSGVSAFNTAPSLDRCIRRIRSELAGNPDLEVYEAAFKAAWDEQQSK